jgi:N-acetylglucosaminyl-diphospho-decaprenol L-rhamnosyltransferase
MPDPKSLDLSVIIVSWNVRDLLAACLDSLAGCGISTETIVVDNASSDGSAAMLAARYPAVRVIANPDNRGFTRANNQGLALSSGRYVLFLNPDTEVVGDALRTMVSYMDEHPRTGALGPRLRFGDGTQQSSRRRFPTLATALFESSPVAWHWPNNRWARWYHMEDCPDDEVQRVDWVVGAALLARRDVLEQIGGFDEGFFMYSEELDWCKRAADAGWEVVYLPAAQIIHYEGKSSEQAVAARHIHFQTSKVRYFRKHLGAAPATLLRLFILAAFALEWSGEAAKWLAGSKRELRRGRMSAYGQLLRSQLR